MSNIQTYSSAVSKEIEEIARHEASKRNFDVNKEKNGLFRAIMHVLSNKELISEAVRRASIKLRGSNGGTRDPE